MGLIILPLIGLYLALLVWATRYGWRRAAKKQLGWGKRCLYAACGFLIVYLPLMWDWIPTELAMRYYCEKDAGLWIYKTVEQWDKENPGVRESLVFDRDSSYSFEYRNKHGNKTIDTPNERIYFTVETTKVFLILPLTKSTLEVGDRRTNQILARYIGYSYSGGKPALGTGYKIWMGGSCDGGIERYEKFSEFRGLFEGKYK